MSHHATRTSFKKGEPTLNPGGRPKKTKAWRVAEDSMREAIPRILAMRKEKLATFLGGNPTVAEMTAWAYIKAYPNEVVDRFVGRTPNETRLTGKDGEDLPVAPVLPRLDLSKMSKTQLDKFIENTGKL